MADAAADQDASILALETLTEIPGGNKRCHKLSVESMSKPPPMRLNALFICLSAILACCEMGGNLIYSGDASNGRSSGFETISMG